MDREHSVVIAKVVKKANRSEIARRTGLSLSGVSRILSGKRTARSGNLAEIAQRLGVSMDDLYKHLNSLKPGRRKRQQQTDAAA